jgi:thioredoxin-related protein
MISIKKSTLPFLTALLTIITFCSFSHAADKAAATPVNAIQWQPYESGIKAIKDGKKKGFLHFYTDWCHYCKIMNKETFTDPKIIAYLNDNFVNIRVNADQEKAVAELFRVKPVPDNWFIGDDATPLSHQPGYIPADKLLVMLQFLHTNSFKTMKFSEFVNQQQKKAAGSGKPATK